MATTVTYKSNTLTTATNETKILKTAGKYMEDDVTITDVSGSSINNQNKNVTPTEAVQSVSADAGYTGLGTVTVAGISSDYVGSGITRRGNVDLTISGPTFQAPAGYYSSAAAKTMSGATLSSPSITYDDELLYIVTRASTAGYVASGTVGTSVVNITTINSLPTKAAQTYTPTTTNQTITAQQWLTGAQTIKGDANLIASNIASGVSIFGVTGTHSGGGGVDLPTFTLVWEDGELGTYESEDYLISITCDKTFQQCLQFLPNASPRSLIARAIEYEESSPDYNPCHSINVADWNSNVIKYVYYSDGQAIYTITYSANSIIFALGGDSNLTLNVAASGTYYPTNGVYTQVNVPAATTSSASIYVDDHDNLVGSVVVTSAGWIPTQTIETTVDPIDLEPNLVSSNIKSGVSIFGVSGSSTVFDTSNATITRPNPQLPVTPQVLSGYAAYGSVGLLTGSMPNRGTLNATISSKTDSVTISYGYYSASTVSISATEQAKIISDNIRSGVTILGISGNTNVVNTSDATAAASQILTGQTAYVAGSKKTGTMSNRGAAQYSIATKSATYTIPSGYHNGSGTVFINWDEQDKIIAGNIKSGVTILGVTGTYTGGGGSGLEYEEGTYSPTSDIARPTISFSKTHTTLPRYIGMQATSGAGQSSSNFGWFLYNYDILNSAGVSYSGTTAIHGQVQWAHRSNSTAITSGGRTITYGQSNTGANTSTYIRYWATESNFKPYSASTTRYWRSGHTYKWVAVW